MFHGRVLFALVGAVLVLVGSGCEEEEEFLLGEEPDYEALQWEGDYEGDGELFSDPQQEVIVEGTNWKQACINAGGSVESRTAFCQSLPSWWTGTRARCWAHVHDSGSGWSNWCYNEFD